LFYWNGATAQEAARIAAPAALELQQSQRLVIVDIRRPEEWRQTGIASGAERATILSRRGDRGFLARIDEITRGDKTAPIGLICAGGVRSRHAARLLYREGYKNVVDIGEGMLGSGDGPGWVARGLPVSTPTDDGSRSTQAP